MTKKKWAYVAVGVGLAMIYSVQQLLAGKTDSSTAQGKLTNSLASIAILGSPGTATTPYVGYALLAVGAWLLFR